MFMHVSIHRLFNETVPVRVSIQQAAHRRKIRQWSSHAKEHVGEFAHLHECWTSDAPALSHARVEPRWHDGTVYLITDHAHESVCVPTRHIPTAVSLLLA
jgi:hypothetical protein